MVRVTEENTLQAQIALLLIVLYSKQRCLVGKHTKAVSQSQFVFEQKLCFQGEINAENSIRGLVDISMKIWLQLGFHA